MLLVLLSSIAVAAPQPLIIAEPIKGNNGQIELSLGLADLHLDGSANGNLLISGIIEPSTRENVKTFSLLNNSIQRYRIESTPQALGWLNWGKIISPQWNVHLSPKLPLEINISLNNGDAALNLSAIKLKNFNFRNKVGDLKLILPATTDYKANIYSDVGNVILQLPANIPYRVSVSALGGDVNAYGDWNGFAGDRNENIYFSGAYQNQKPFVDIYIESRRGDITLEMLSKPVK